MSAFEDHAWKDIAPDDLLQIYAPYERETFIGPAPALLCIDLYNIVYKGGAKPPVEIQDEFPNTCGMYAHAAIEPTLTLIAAARRAGLPVFWCTQDRRPMNRPMGVGSTKRKNAGFKDEDFGIYEAFEPQPEDVMITKQRASIFQGTPIVSHLNFLGVKSLIVCGESTSGCVRASCVDAYSNGFHVTLAEEATFDRHELIHKVNLFDLHHKYVDVMHVPEIVDVLDGGTQQAAAAE
ncbi:isochorismatase family protein [Acuticoccus sp. MNP-M23]|uniref:cysteine hydrolase family protein n=1 Tax=Acuticoccus sp. MNP-M23 TaxID=3072793 RepID=UPI0028162042|nr:isochorismatase family protein [Acuticoccus sp. MNP-M23]WMS41678.1 isochorismatase family protein [Acuticoccus sp. MNP-M23]